MPDRLTTAWPATAIVLRPAPAPDGSTWTKSHPSAEEM
jgi:hypothetical protein